MAKRKMSRDQEKAMFAKGHKPSSKSKRIYMPTYMNPRVKSPTMLMTQQMRKDIPPLYSQDGKKPENVTVHAHYFTPFSSWDWYITEFDGKDTMFGLVKGQDVELGYVSLGELESQGMNVERDRYWNKKSLAEVMKDTNYPHYKEEKPTIERQLNFSTWREGDKWYYDIRKDKPLSGEVLASGGGYSSNKEAEEAMDKDKEKAVKKYYSSKKGLSANEDKALPKSAKTYKVGDRTQISQQEPLYGKGGSSDRLDGKKGTIVSISKDNPRAKVKLDNGRTVTIAKGFLKYKPFVEK